MKFLGYRHHRREMIVGSGLPNASAQTVPNLRSQSWAGKLAEQTTAGLAALLLFLDAGPAFAYLDPGTASIILQSVIGAIAAGLFAGKIYFHRIKAFFSRGVKQPDAIEGPEIQEEEHR